MSLEARLAETEAALFQTVAEQLGAPYANGEQLLIAFQEYHARQTRSARLDYWENTSLATAEARHEWWVEARGAVVHSESETASRQPPIQPLSGQVHSSNATSAADHQGQIPSISVTSNRRGSTQLSSPPAGHPRYF